MSDYERLRELLKPTPYLVADPITGTVELVPTERGLQVIEDGGPFPTTAVLKLVPFVDGFADEVGREDRMFTMREIAEIAGMAYHAAYYYCTRVVLHPSLRGFGGHGTGRVEARFSWADAFCAGVVGTLRRYGLKPDQLRKVRELFVEESTSEKKQTAREAATSGRS